jgi:poly-gamma-glutamate synthesis protein (capsule biosynthesis protein)
MAACSTFSDQSEAGAARPDFPGKPGINALHHDVVHLVPASVFSALREAKRELGYEEYEDVHHRFHPHRAEHYDREAEVRFLGRTFRLADGYGIETSCRAADLDGIERWIRGSCKHTDWRIYSLHSHESGPDGEIHEVCRESPPAFATEFAHRAIDGGELSEIRLHPVDLGFGKPLSQRGRPLPASREVADEIVAWLQRLSEPYGTRIENEDGVGVVRV